MLKLLRTLLPLLICIICCVQPVEAAKGQEVTVNIDNKSLKEFFKIIEEQTLYHFSYDSGIIDNKSDITIHMVNKPLGQILDKAFSNRGISYRILSDNTIVLSKKGDDKTSQRSKTIPISGTVTDENGDPIIGATVRGSSPSEITVTDLNGKFILNVPPKSTVEVSYIGYNTVKLVGESTDPVSVVLSEDNNVLDEVVVVGYGTQKKVNLTGSVSAIDAKEIENRPIRSVTDALQGHMPGLTVQSGTGEPGTYSSFKIRGNTSVNSAGALVIVDGMPGDLNLVNPQDVESVSVLKDAAAAAIYGARAAEGVILVTTRQGKDKKVKVEYSDNFAFNSPTRLPKSNTGYDHAVLSNLSFSNAGLAVNFPEKALIALQDPSVSALVNGNDWIYTDNTDWIGMMFDHSFQQTHDLAVSKASESIKYRISVGWLDQDGMFSDYGPDNFDRYNLRSNISTDLIKDKLTLDSKITYTETVRRNHPQFSSWSIPYITMIQAGPNMPVYDPNGNYARYRMQANPVQALREGGETKTRTERAEGIFTLSYKPIKGLTMKAIGAGRIINSQRKVWRREYGKYGPNGLISSAAGQSGPNRLNQSSETTRYLTGQLLADYTVNINRHDFYLLLGWSAEQNHYESLTGERTNIIGNELPALSLGSTDGWSNAADETEWALLSGFMRFNYTYANKYLFEANLRADASSRFSKKHRWGYFPSFSAGWRISEEEFMKDITSVSNIKLRASWGRLGNQNGLGLYDHIAQYSIGGFYPFGSELAQWAKVNNLPSEDRTWETVEVTNVGIDLGFLNNRLTAEAEIFKKHTKDMLVSIEIPSVIGINVPTGNYGELEVKGWNISIGWADRVGKVSYSAKFSLSDQNDKLVDYGVDFNGFTAGLNRRIEGYSLGSIFGYKTDGYFKTDDEAKSSAVFNRSVTGAGDIKYVDIDGDGKISAPNDLAYLGSAVPRYVFGLSLSADWNGFDMSMLLQGVGKRNFYLSSEVMAPFRDTWGNFSYTLHNDYWTPDNLNAANPRPYAGTSHNYQISDHWLQNAAYVRMKNLQIGYTLPRQLLSKVHIDRLRLYFSGDNLFEFSKLNKNFDPELTSSDGYIYPLLRSYSFGLNLTF